MKEQRKRYTPEEKVAIRHDPQRELLQMRQLRGNERG